jgi:hypothetical protein
LTKPFQPRPSEYDGPHHRLGRGGMTIIDYIAIGFLIAFAMVIAAKLSLRANS